MDDYAPSLGDLFSSEKPFGFDFWMFVTVFHV